ncbi:MAG: polysaccharide deacetylase family protein [Paludibacteraceae bacterium]|nr:polysaccharide deacetylase family protein [Paludibacteraceae bacterium]
MKKIILTIDTEGPRGSNPVLFQIWGKVGNEYYGIPKIIEICDKYGVKGLFFVDIPEIWDMGYDAIKEVILYIKNKGHNVGVHIHPHHMPNETRQFLYEYSREEQYQIIEQCTKKYIEITGEQPLSFRAGKYGANRDTLDILSDLGYLYDFSEFYSQKWCGINPEVAYVLPIKYRNIIEFPVTVYKSLSIPHVYCRYDKLEATSMPGEILHVLKQYGKTSNEEVIVLFLHSFSFLNYLETPDKPTVNSKNIRYFQQTLDNIRKLDYFGIIEEKELHDIHVVEEDNINNVVKTKGFLRQAFYFYKRARRIVKSNKKARVFISGCYMIGIAFIIMLCILFFYIWRV